MNRFDNVEKWLIRIMAGMLFLVWCVFALEVSAIVGWYSGQYLLRWIINR